MSASVLTVGWGQLPESIWGEALRKEAPLSKPATKVTTSMQEYARPSRA
jgi:hypothetical protein